MRKKKCRSGITQEPVSKGSRIFSLCSPGIFVHLPVMLFFVLLGIWFTLGDPWLYPLFLVYAVIGIYFGRDVAIFAHYNGLITIVVVGGWVALIRSPVPPPHFAPLISAAITGAITIVFATYVSWYVDLDNDEKPKTSSAAFRSCSISSTASTTRQRATTIRCRYDCAKRC